MGWRLLDDDPVRTEWFAHDEASGESAVRTVYKGTGRVLELNKDIQGKGVARGREGDWWHVARIPPAVIHKWLVEDRLNVFDRADGARLMKKLDDPQWRHLRVNTARLGRRRKML